MHVLANRSTNMCANSTSNKFNIINLIFLDNQRFQNDEFTVEIWVGNVWYHHSGILVPFPSNTTFCATGQSRNEWPCLTPAFSHKTLCIWEKTPECSDWAGSHQAFSTQISTANWPIRNHDLSDTSTIVNQLRVGRVTLFVNRLYVRLHWSWSISNIITANTLGLYVLFTTISSGKQKMLNLHQSFKYKENWLFRKEIAESCCLFSAKSQNWRNCTTFSIIWGHTQSTTYTFVFKHWNVLFQLSLQSDSADLELLHCRAPSLTVVNYYGNSLPHHLRRLDISDTTIELNLNHVVKVPLNRSFT